MKKRMFALLLTVVMAVSVMAVPAAATEQFSDVTDNTTATAVEVLRLMGVLDGYGDGTFRPESILNRAQFCKMATYATDSGDELGRYRAVTIFPDVKPSYWAAAYINMAAKGRGIISGYPDGNFYPDRTVTLGHAVTILLRVLGYADTDVGGIWPDSYLAVADSIGLTKGIYASGSAGVTRAQAARLFLNLLDTKTAKGGTLYTLTDEADLIAVDGGAGELKTSDGKVYTMVNPVASSTLVGSRGRVVLNDKGEALTFLPSSIGSSGVANAAVIVYADGSAAGFDALAGNSEYTIFKNGQQVGSGALRKYDVATYQASTNTIRVCDTRLSVYYESCTPRPEAPTQITVLGQKFNVLPTAQDSMADFKPGEQVTLLLTADGQVAGAVKPGTSGAQGNALAVVDDGAVKLVCGSTLLELTGISAEEKYDSQAVRVSSNGKGAVTYSIQTTKDAGLLNLQKNTLGSKPLAENVLLLDGGKPVGAGQLGQTEIPSSRIAYARTNWAGEVDLVVLDSFADEIYGRVIRDRTLTTYEYEDVVDGELVTIRIEPGEEGYVTTWKEEMSVVYGNGAGDRVGPFSYEIRGIGHGDFVVAKLNRNKTGFITMEKLTKLTNVSDSAWIGKTAVTAGGQSYSVPADVLCFNEDGDTWMTLDQAMSYADAADLYVKSGVVHIVVVGG